MSVDSIVGRTALAQQAIARAAEATGVDFGLLVRTAARESAFDHNARARTSSATGLFQFVERTWLDVVRRHGANHGLGAAAASIELRGGRPFVADPKVRAAILELRNDPEISARMAGELTRENADILNARLGRPAAPGELYVAHFLGADGAVRLIQAADAGATDAAALFPQAAAANRSIFHDGETPRSAAAVLARLTRSFSGDVAGGTIPPSTAIELRDRQAAGRGGDSLALDAPVDHAAFFEALFGPADGERPDPLFALAAYRRTGWP